jgi:diguanylate cyclase (GGDEF)-like protein
MKKFNVLIVEDSKPILALHKNLVTRAGFNPITAETLEQVKLLEPRFPEFFCAIIDYSLPDAPNGEAIAYLLARNVPGIVMTGMIDDETRNNILQLPVIDYITKENKQAYPYLQHLLEKLRVNHLTKILVVGESQDTRNHLKDLLERHNYHVIQARCGSAAIEELEKHPQIKLVITEKEMATMDGLELCNQIRSKYSKDEISIIGLSEDNNQSLTAKFIKNGANDFLTTPFCIEEFYCRVLQNIEYIENVAIIQRQANTDYLTGLFNRRYFFEQVSPIIKRRYIDGINSTLAMIDIDYFKSVNDTYGHDAGDVVLKSIAKLMQRHFSPNYLAARVGGEEFCIFLDTTSRNQAIMLLDDFRKDIENMLVDIGIGSGKNTITCTISVGITHGCDSSFDEIMIKADELLYDAKDSGRNMVIAD